MHSIKPGRGPSAMGAVGSLVGIIFGIFWTIMAASIGAPKFFVGFGFVFVGLGVFQLFYNLHNATAKNRMSTFDITSDHEESDPIAQALGHSRVKPSPPKSSSGSPAAFCPYCGEGVATDYEFCPKCGKDI